MVEGLEAVGGEEIDKGKETGTDEEMDGTSKVVQEILADLKIVQKNDVLKGKEKSLESFRERFVLLTFSEKRYL